MPVCTWGSEKNFWGLVLFFSHVSPQGWMEVVATLRGEWPVLLSHPTGPAFCLLLFWNRVCMCGVHVACYLYLITWMCVHVRAHVHGDPPSFMETESFTEPEVNLFGKNCPLNVRDPPVCVSQLWVTRGMSHCAWLFNIGLGGMNLASCDLSAGT